MTEVPRVIAIHVAEALRRRGGSIFRVLEGGEIRLGVAVVPEPTPTV